MSKFSFSEKATEVSKNIPLEDKYVAELNARLESHNVRSRLGKLDRGTTNGKMTRKQRKELEKIERVVTESMLAAEDTLPKRNSEEWTPKLKEITSGIVYYRQLLKWSRGQPMDPNRLEKLRREGGKRAKATELPFCFEGWTSN